MGASQNELLTSELFFKAAFPVMKVVLNDDPKTKKSFAKVKAQVVIKAKNEDDVLGATLVFNNGQFEVLQEIVDKPDLTLSFSTVEKMNVMFKGGNSLPKIKGLKNIRLLVKVLLLLLSLKLMMPSATPKNKLKRYLKVKMTIYMITTALSVYNKVGNEDMKSWTTSQPDRIYQFTVDPYEDNKIAAYLRVKNGKTKAGRGIYTRKKPFVNFRFIGVDGAYSVLQKDVEFVEGVEKGCIIIEGSPEYGAQLNDIMGVLQGMLT